MAFIGIDRGIVDHWIYKDAEYFKVWFEMLYRARYAQEPKTDIEDGELYTIQYGEFIYGRPKWSARIGISEQRLKTLVKKLTQEGMIEVTSRFRRFTIYKIINYEKYNQQGNQPSNQQGSQEQQGFSGIGNQQNNQQINQPSTSSQPASNQPATTKEQSKQSNKVNKEKDNKKHYAEFVSLTEEEYQKLVSEHGESFTARCITILDNYKGANKKKYASDYRAILNWVISRATEEVDKEKRRTAQPDRTKTGRPTMSVVSSEAPGSSLSPEERARLRELARNLDAS